MTPKQKLKLAADLITLAKALQLEARDALKAKAAKRSKLKRTKVVKLKRSVAKYIGPKKKVAPATRRGR